MKKSSDWLRSASICFAIAFPAVLGAQQGGLTASLAPHLLEPAASVAAPIATPQSHTPTWENRFDRWVDLRDLTYSMRYRTVADSNGAHEFNQGQERSIVDGKFKFDSEGKYGIVFHASSGKYFNWAYADVAGGGNAKALSLEFVKANPNQQGHLGFFASLFPGELKASEQSGGWSFYVRRLYLDVEPVEGLEGQYGSLDINRGAGTEITTYDYDGYIDGERLLIKRPDRFFFDEASITYAYIGDLYTPNFFARGERLAHSNYHQFLLRKKIAKRVDASFDYTWQNGSNTLREAARVRLPESRIVDSFGFESYQRIGTRDFPRLPFPLPVTGGNGFAITLDKKVNSRLSVEAGMADIDYGVGLITADVYSYDLGLALSGDSYGVGKRYFTRPTVKLTPYLEATGYYTNSFGQVGNYNQIIWNKQAINAGLNFNIKKALFPKESVQ